MSAVTVNESEDVAFECSVDSNPSSNIEIHYKDKVIFRQNDIHTLLYIRDNIACLDAGEYTCAARNPHNKGLDSERHLMVNVRCSPRPLYQRRQTFSSALHTQALLSFTALAYPEPGTNGFVWHKQHSSTWIPLLSNADLRISTSGLQTNLTITNVSKSDFGHYKVTVTNEIGKYEQHLYLTENIIGQTNSQPTLDDNVMIVSISLGLLCASLIGYAVFSTVIFKRKLKGIRLKSNEDPTNQMTYVNHSYGNVYCSADTSDKTQNDDNMDDSVHQYTDLTQFIRDDQKEAYEEIQKI
ncbi:disorganized muscle protein 1-like [Ruditapes philippinarum]|uniref:disorganized muscle protein 1-like n=1 Tax=Ruditapes philippinarum TaxID=129788 RepID=UPI00295B9EC1|nr:disorganized muscle protein 1-like [Ruditapes philippinarum]